MIKDFVDVLEQYSAATKKRFEELFQIVEAVSPPNGSAQLWAKLPSYYVGEQFIRLIPFQDHINIQASAVNAHRSELAGYKITPKGMLQIYNNQPIPTEVFRSIVRESL